MSVTIRLIVTKTVESEKYSADPEKKLFLEQETPTQSLFGESSLTDQDRKELIAQFSGMRAKLDRRTLSDRLTKSLISAGLVKGITPMSVRRELGAPIQDFVIYLPDGTRVEQLSLD